MLKTENVNSKTIPNSRSNWGTKDMSFEKIQVYWCFFLFYCKYIGVTTTINETTHNNNNQ